MDMNEVLIKYNIVDDINLMESFIDECLCPVCDMNEYLKDWYEAKSKYLFKLFGDKLTIDCGEVEFKKTKDDVINDILADEELKNDINNLYHFIFIMSEKCESIHFFNILMQCTRISFLVNYMLNVNKLQKIKTKLKTDNGKDEYFYIHANQKPDKVLKNFLRIINKVFPNEFTEEIKTANKLISKIFSKIAMYTGRTVEKGKVVLSIHPFDYITMSQNNSNWTSCMAILDKYDTIGDYCAGTVALMNSPCAIIAYRENNTQYFPCVSKEFADTAWNNKGYRNVFIVDPIIITGVKGYPNLNNDLDDIILNKLKELAASNLGWKFTDIQEDNKKDFENISIVYYTDKMYNDIDNNLCHCITGYPDNLNKNKSNAVKEKSSSQEYWALKYDAPVKCFECLEDIGTSQIPRCNTCQGVVRCCECDEEIPEGYELFFNDTPYCEYCYDEHINICDECDKIVEKSQSFFGNNQNAELGNVIIQMVFKENDYQQKLDNYHKQLMNNCFALFPTKFDSINAGFLCKECLSKAIDNGYVVFGEYKDFANDETPLYRAYFYTDKAIAENKYDFPNISNMTAIGFETYLKEVSNFVK